MQLEWAGAKSDIRNYLVILGEAIVNYFENLFLLCLNETKYKYQPKTASNKAEISTNPPGM